MFAALEALTLHQSTGAVVDGKPQYADTTGRGRLIESFVHVPGPEGLTRTLYTILVAPPLVPARDCRITIGGKTYRIGGVRVCRDLDGKLVGCRCEVVQ